AAARCARDVRAAAGPLRAASRRGAARARLHRRVGAQRLDAALRPRPRAPAHGMPEIRRARPRSRRSRRPAPRARTAARAHPSRGGGRWSAPAGPDLRDIHLPPDPSWWPPAPGWWLLAIALLVLAAFAIRTLVRAWRERAWQRRVALELDRIA